MGNVIQKKNPRKSLGLPPAPPRTLVSIAWPNKPWRAHHLAPRLGVTVFGRFWDGSPRKFDVRSYLPKNRGVGELLGEGELVWSRRNIVRTGQSWVGWAWGHCALDFGCDPSFRLFFFDWQCHRRMGSSIRARWAWSTGPLSTNQGGERRVVTWAIPTLLPHAVICVCLAEYHPVGRLFSTGASRK
jgi:hypothetical protein